MRYGNNRLDWDKGVRKLIRGKYLVLEVDTNVAQYHGRPWKTLGNFGKRKWENFLYLHNQSGRTVVFRYKP